MTEKSPHAPSAKWTPTPWHSSADSVVVLPLGVSFNDADDHDRRLIACTYGDGTDKEEDCANAARIVACVNALSPIQGDPAEALAKARSALRESESTICALLAGYGRSAPESIVIDCQAACARNRESLAALGSPL